MFSAGFIRPFSDLSPSTPATTLSRSDSVQIDIVHATCHHRITALHHDCRGEQEITAFEFGKLRLTSLRTDISEELCVRRGGPPHSDVQKHHFRQN